MIATPEVRTHWSFWLVGSVALIWNLMGCFNFVMQLDAEIVASYPENHRAIIEGRPAWATAGFAVAVFGGALGSILLLFRKSAARYFFLASLLGVIAAMAHTLRVFASGVEYRPFEVVLIMVMPVVVAIFLVWYSGFAERRSWIRGARTFDNTS